MHLNDLLAIEGSPLEPSSICLMRHTDRELGDYLHDPPILSFYTSVQKRGKLDRYKYAMAFVASSSGKTVFRGIYQILDRSPLLPEHYSSLFLPDAIICHYDTLCALDEYDYYTISASPHLSAYSGRVVVDWGGAKIVWFQSFSATNPKEILEILPTGFFRPFESYSSVSLARSELEFLCENSDSNPEWVGHLSRVAGIYLILDEGSGDQYIGSASGEKGIWGRWSDYFEDPTGGNILLRQRLNAVPEAYRRFRYSLLEALPGNTVKAEVVAKENLYKKMLGTRTHGLNLN